MSRTIKHKLEIKPAIDVGTRHKIERLLEESGFNVWAGGSHTDGSACDIAFDGQQKEK